nr:hypothetical protein [Cryobacterium breve]
MDAPASSIVSRYELPRLALVMFTGISTSGDRSSRSLNRQCSIPNVR